MAVKKSISFRELQENAEEILDAVADGEHFIMTHDGAPVGELTPARNHFASRERLFQVLRDSQPLDAARFRADIDEPLDQDIQPLA
jgi:antitoxin (DNA-binding transcriptional repressor) of toxin-antitoxin stability system